MHRSPMPIRLSNIRMSVDEPELALPARLARASTFARRHRAVAHSGKSLDARDKSAVAFVYSVEVVVPGDERRAMERMARRSGRIQVEPYEEPAVRAACGRERAARSSGRW